MGVRLLGRALEPSLTPISPAARLVLATMALHALDSQGRNPADEPGLYWGGHAALAYAMGYPGFTPAARRHVTRAVAELTDAGRIKREAAGSGRNHAVYRLLL
jgi:hypothetical protein